MVSNLTLFLINIVIVSNIVVQIIYFHYFLWLYYLIYNMDDVIPVMSIFLAESALSELVNIYTLRNKIKKITSKYFLFV